jgi:hypothetical protein
VRVLRILAGEVPRGESLEAVLVGIERAAAGVPAGIRRR